MNLSLEDFYDFCKRKNDVVVIYNHQNQRNNDYKPRRAIMKFNEIQVSPNMKRIYVKNDHGLVEYDNVKYVDIQNEPGNVFGITISCGDDNVTLIEDVLLLKSV